jgi:ABC-2 type transport system permease protein
MSTEQARGGRLSTLQAAYVIARRDFVAILFSRTFLFFLLGPLFPVLVGSAAGGIGAKAQLAAEQPQLGLAMSAADNQTMVWAWDRMEARLGKDLPKLVVLAPVKTGDRYDPDKALADRKLNLGAVLTGTPTRPVLTGSDQLIRQWQNPVSLIAAEATSATRRAYPAVSLQKLGGQTRADDTRGQMLTAQAGQLLLFLLTMMLAGMVLSNLVEEKGNKIIEVLAAAIPMDAVFLGKLFAMLAVSMVGITVWGLTGGSIALLSGRSLSEFTSPAVGWPLFFAFGVIYFSMGYLLLGSLFLAIGSLATTVREVQTLSMPVTFLQLFVFFFASFAMALPNTPLELAAIAFPLSSPFAMLARAAQDPALWPHALALVWQALCVGLMVRGGAALFRKRVMHSGSGGAVKRSIWQRAFGRG